MTQKQKLEVFKENQLFNKEEVQKSFNSFIEHHQTTDEEGYSEEKREKILELSGRFKVALEKCRLPELKDDWWYYDYEFVNDGIELSLFLCEKMELDENGEIDSMTSSQEFTMVSVKCDYLTVEQYASLYGVTTTTVRQWIRRGKLRSAKKFGRDWLIPSIADKPTRGFESVTYSWNQLPETILKEFPFLNGYDCVYIFQDEQDKSMFHCIMGRPMSDHRSKTILTTQEREKMELALISNSIVKVEELSSGIMFKPYKE